MVWKGPTPLSILITGEKTGPVGWNQAANSGTSSSSTGARWTSGVPKSMVWPGVAVEESAESLGKGFNGKLIVLAGQEAMKGAARVYTSLYGSGVSYGAGNGFWPCAPRI